VAGWGWRAGRRREEEGAGICAFVRRARFFSQEKALHPREDMLEHQYYALGACLALFAAALAYSARAARAYHSWYKKQKDQARARDLLKKMQAAGEVPSPFSSPAPHVSEEQAVARRACPFAKWAQESTTCPVSGASNEKRASDKKEEMRRKKKKKEEEEEEEEHEEHEGAAAGKTENHVTSGRPLVPKHPQEKYGSWYQTNKTTVRKLRERKKVLSADT
jgi:hypothetical protein